MCMEVYRMAGIEHGTSGAVFSKYRVSDKVGLQHCQFGSHCQTEFGTQLAANGLAPSACTEHVLSHDGI